MTNNLLTVCLITYNQKKYVRQALDSIFAQKTNFNFNVVIADDFSTDGTREIINEFKDKYGDKIDLIFQEKNVGAAQNYIDLLHFPTSKYIAYLEGDDYWTEPLKLQMQVDFLEKNEDYSLTTHHREVLRENKFTFIKAKFGYVFYQCFVYRSFEIDNLYLETLNKIKYGDSFQYYKLLSLGKCKILDFNGAVYRIHDKGIHSSLNRKVAVMNSLESLIETKNYHKVLKNNKVVKIINTEITKLYVFLLIKSIKEFKILDFLKTLKNSFSNISILDYFKIVKNKFKPN